MSFADRIARILGNELQMCRWWHRDGWHTPPSRVLCYVRGDRRAYVWRTERGTLPPIYHVMYEVGGAYHFGSWGAAFAAARAHVGFDRAATPANDHAPLNGAATTEGA